MPFPFRKKKSRSNSTAMPAATANDVVNAVDDLRPALEEAVRTCNNSSVVPSLAKETFNLILQPVRDLPDKLARGTLSADSSVSSADYGALVSTVRDCKEKTYEFSKEVENKNKAVMLASLKEIVEGVLHFVENASFGFHQNLITSLNAKAQDLQQAIEKGTGKSKDTFHNHSTGQQIGFSGVGDQMLNTGSGGFFMAPFTSNGPMSFGAASTQEGVTPPKSQS